MGSLRSALSYEYVKSQKIKINPNKYDICLVSEPHSILNGDYFQVKNMAECSALIAEFTYKLCKKHNLNLIFTGEGQIGDMEFKKGNKALRDHIFNEKKVFLFKETKKTFVRFVAEISFIEYQFIQIPDINKNNRRAIQFIFKKI